MLRISNITLNLIEMMDQSDFFINFSKIKHVCVKEKNIIIHILNNFKSEKQKK